MNRKHLLSGAAFVAAFASAVAAPPWLPPPETPIPTVTPDPPALQTRPSDNATESPKSSPEPPKSDEPIQIPNLPPSLIEEGLKLKPVVNIRGRIETDALFAAQSTESIATIGNLQNGFGFRRVRFGAQGEIGDAANWVSEVELAGGTVRLKDVYIGLTAFPLVREVRVGHFREPFSLEGATSSNHMTFMERSSLNDFDPARNWGVSTYWWPDNERGTLALGVFRSDTGNTGQSIGDDNTWALTARATRLPVYEPDAPTFQLVHLGAAFSYRNPPNGVVNFSPSPASNLLTVDDNPVSPFLPAVEIPANSLQLYNLQAARVVGPYSVQGEWFAATVQQTSAGAVFVHGFYLDGSVFLTGEHRGYNRTRGSFDKVAVLRPLLRDRNDPRGGYGAFELTTRFSFGDFNSPQLPLADDGNSVGSVLYSMTLGLNWYLNENTRLMLNYTPTLSDRVDGKTVSAHIFGARLAVYW